MLNNDVRRARVFAGRKNKRFPFVMSLTWALVSVLVNVFGCSRGEDGSQSARSSKVDRASALSNSNKERSSDTSTEPLDRLRLPYSQGLSILGAHRYQAKAVVKRLVSGQEKTLVVETTLLLDEKGNFRGVKNTDPQYGQEVIFTGGWLYLRRRYGRFIRRRPQDGEAKKKLDQLAGGLGAYVDLLRPHVQLDAGSKFTRRKHPRQPQVEVGPAKNWRRSIRLVAVDGAVEFDPTGRIPLNTKLKATWDYLPPEEGAPKNGIPRQANGGKRGQMVLDFEQSITILKDSPEIIAPQGEELLYDSRRQRLEIERQMLLGERPIPKNWPRITTTPTTGKPVSP